MHLAPCAIPSDEKENRIKRKKKGKESHKNRPETIESNKMVSIIFDFSKYILFKTLMVDTKGSDISPSLKT